MSATASDSSGPLLHGLKDIEQEVELEKVRLLFNNTGIGQLVTIVNAGLLVFALGGLNPPVWALAWWATVSAAAALRYGLAWQFKRAHRNAPERPRLWGHLAMAGSLMMGIAWSSGCAAMTVSSPGGVRLFAGLLSAGMAAGAVPLLSSVLRVYWAYAIPVTLTVAVTAALDANTRIDWMLALILLFFIALLLRSSKHFHDTIDRAARLAFLMKDLARRAEDSELLFRTLAESTNAAIFTFRERFEYVNPAGERLTGYSQDELRAMPFGSILHPDDRQKAEERGRARVAGGKMFTQHQYRIVTRSGEIRWIELFGALVTMDGLPTGLGSAFDITNHKLTEDSLRENETKFHTMLDWTHDWEYWIDPKGAFNYMTPSALQVTGYTVREFEANPDLLEAIVHPEDRSTWQFYFRRQQDADGARTTKNIKLRILHKSGEVIWVDHTCRPIFDENGAYLGRRITSRDITSQKAAEEAIRSLAYYDPLTHLPNRRLLMDRLGQALMSRTPGYGALMILDLDNFKSLNDTRGHDVGDRLLVEVAHRLGANVRGHDTVARLGGDEYVVLLEDVGHTTEAASANAETIAEKILQALNRPYRLEGQEEDYRSTTSIGLTLFRGDDVSAEVLLKQADVALYQAKDAGRNNVRFFNPSMQAAIDARAALETALRLGVERGELQLYYQPQVDLEGRLIGAEALVRWRSPDRGVVPPAQFIPLAEDTGLILPLGEWVLTTACAQLKAWASHPHTQDLRIAVNVSAAQFHQPDFVARVSSIVAASGADPGRLKLELTESVVLSNAEEVIARMHQLDRMGIGFSLDDFGTGYSSLSYLKRLPLAQVKIDQSFVRDIPHDANDAAIVRAILAMCQSLGIQAIAEGVETAEQRDFLVESGCRAFQGYLFGRPMPIEQWQTLFP